MHRFRLLRVNLLALMTVAALPAARAADPFAECESAAPALPITVPLALRRVAACNHELIAARRAVLANRADLRIAGQSPNPTLTAGLGGINPSAGIGSGSPWRKTVDSSLRYEQLLERGGKRALRVQVAEQAGAAARSDLAEAQRQQGVAAVQALIDLAAADARSALLREVATLYDDTARANALRLRSGDLAPIDAQRQAIEAARAQADVAQAAADALRARQALAALLGWETSAGALQAAPGVLEEPAASPAPPPGEPASLDSDVDVDRRADVVAAQARAASARAARDLAAAQAKGDITVGVQADHYPTSASNSYGTGNSVGFTLAVPLTFHHRFEGELARAVSDSDAADEALRRVRVEALAERAQLDAELQAAQSRLALLRSAQVPLAEQVAQAAEIGHARGALGLLELLDARRTLRQTRLDVLAARADAARAAFARSRWLAQPDDLAWRP